MVWQPALGRVTYKHRRCVALIASLALYGMACLDFPRVWGHRWAATAAYCCVSAVLFTSGCDHRKASFETGRSAGQAEGYKAGHADGYKAGVQASYSEGFKEGRDVGKKRATMQGFSTLGPAPDWNTH